MERGNSKGQLERSGSRGSRGLVEQGPSTPAEQRHSASTPRSTHSLPALEYPAYVVPIKVFLAMHRWVPHHELMASGLLVKAVPGAATSFAFVSHQWRACGHPDADGQQLRVLQAAVRRLLAGGSRVRVDSASQVTAFASTAVSTEKQTAGLASHWQASLSAGFIWLDYMCVPQPSALNNTKDREEAAVARQKAVRSIVSYVRMASSFLVLAPPLLRTEEPFSPVNFGTWQRRGWCLMERACWALAKRQHGQGMLLIEDKATITLQRAESLLASTVGEAEWGNPADLEELAPILQELLDIRWEKCQQQGDAEGLQSLLVAECRHLCGARTPARAQAPQPSEEDAVAAFLAECGLEKAASSRDGLGRSALHVASARGDVAVVAALLRRRADPCAGTSAPDAEMLAGATPLHYAAAWCCGPEPAAKEVLGLLLAARAAMEPAGRFRSSPLHVAAQWNNATTTGLLLEMGAKLEKRNTFGLTALGCAVLHASQDALQVLLDRRASLEQGRPWGRREHSVSVCHLAACSSAAEATLPLLIAAGADVNAASNPLSGLMPVAAKMALATLGLGRRETFLLQTLASESLPPLAVAAAAGNVQAVHSLLHYRADTEWCNARGQGCLDLARKADELSQSPSPALHILLGDETAEEESNCGDSMELPVASKLLGNMSMWEPLEEPTTLSHPWVISL